MMMMMMQSRPRLKEQVKYYFSPATSTNKKPTTRWSPTAQSESEDYDHYLDTTYNYLNNNDDDDDDDDDDDQQSWSQLSCGSDSGGKKSSEMLMLMVKEQCRVSSYASCNAFSMGSLMDKCPKTPSPICSPINNAHSHDQVSNAGVDHQLSFATPNQSSCIVNVDGNPDDGVQEEQEPQSAANYSATPFHRNNNARSRMKNMREAEEGSSKKHKTKSRYKAVRYAEPSRRYFSWEPKNSTETSKYYADDYDKDQDDDDGRLAAIIEEQEEVRANRHARHPDTTPQLSSGSGSSDGHRYENSDIDIDSIIEDHLEFARRRKPFRVRAGFEDESWNTKMAAKLSSWKEAKTMKIMNKLRSEEAAIDEWEKKKTTEAKMDMKEKEMNLEKMRTHAMQKMQRTIQSTQKEAENRKAYVRAAANNKTAEVNKAFKKTGVTGKLSCRLFCI